MKKAVLLLILIGLFSCEKDSLSIYSLNESNEKLAKVSLKSELEISDIISEVKNEFDFSGTMQKSNKNSFKVNFSNAIEVVDSVGNKTYSLEITREKLEPKKIYNLVVVRKRSGKRVAPFVMEYVFENGDKYTYAISSNKRFEGKINVYSLNRFFNKPSIAGMDPTDPCWKDIDTNSDPSSDGTSSGTSSSGGSGSGSGSGSGGGKTEGSTSWAPYYVYEPSPRRGSVEVGEGNFGKPGTDGENMQKYYTSSAKDSDCPEDDSHLIAINTLIDVISDAFESEFPCQADLVQCAFNASSPLNLLVRGMFGEGNDTRMTFGVGNLDGSNAVTNANISYNSQTKECFIKVTMDRAYLENATDLSIARTAIHESMHAVLVQMSYAGHFSTPSGNPKEGYEALMNGYVDYISQNDDGSNYASAQHEILASLNQDLATALSSVGKDLGYSINFNHYEIMSWAGLMGTNEFNTLFPKYLDNGSINPEWVTIMNTNLAEQDNVNPKDGNNITISPKGNPCP